MGLLRGYNSDGYYCELSGLGDGPLPHASRVAERLDGMRPRTLRRRARDCEHELLNMGITFTVYSERDAIDRVLPFDVIPRLIAPEEW